MDNELLKDTVLKLKDRIIKTEAGNIQLSETDTRQGLINPAVSRAPVGLWRFRVH